MGRGRGGKGLVTRRPSLIEAPVHCPCSRVYPSPVSGKRQGVYAGRGGRARAYIYISCAQSVKKEVGCTNDTATDLYKKATVEGMQRSTANPLLHLGYLGLCESVAYSIALNTNLAVPSCVDATRL